MLKIKKAFAGIELLIALLIIALLFIYFSDMFFPVKNTIRNNNEKNLNVDEFVINTGEDEEVVREKINQQLDELQKQRQKSLDEQQKMLDEFNN